MSSVETENKEEPLREVPNLGQVLVNIGEVAIGSVHCSSPFTFYILRIGRFQPVY